MDTDVNDMSVSIDHNVSVVSVFDLKQKPDDTIGGHTFDEIPSRLLKTIRRLVPISLQKIIIQ